MYILETNSFKYYLGERLLFKLPALKLHTKSRIGLIGLDGSGKTTLLELLAGIRPIPAAAKIICKTTMTILPQLKERLSKSGGETTQAYILQALKQQSGLLLADEPTNNLDMDHLLWLEKELRHYSGALILVSHDRDFLDALCNEIWALDDKQLQIYQGNYSNYQQQKIISEKTHDQAYRKYIMQKTHLETAFSAKQQQAQKAVKTTKISLSEARITGAKPYFAKKQKKLQQTGQSLLTRLDKLKQIEKRQSLPIIKMNLLSSKLWQGQILVRAHNWSYIIDKKPLWQTVSFSVKSGDKLAIIGPNGCGKTTLLKQFLKAHNKHLPNVQIAGGAKIGYFSQDIDILDPDKNLLRNLQSTSSQSEALLRTVLIRLRFKRKDFFKPIQLLSGGEKVKAALAKILVSDCNVLMLDEPTNHLDLDAVTALEELLCNYPGTLIFTTHDRRLLKAIAKNLLVFDGTKLNFFPGPYDDYSNKQISTEYIEATADILLIENKLAEIISRLSLNPTEKLEAEFQSLLAKKRLLLSKQSS